MAPNTMQPPAILPTNAGHKLREVKKSSTTWNHHGSSQKLSLKQSELPNQATSSITILRNSMRSRYSSGSTNKQFRLLRTPSGCGPTLFLSRSGYFILANSELDSSKVTNRITSLGFPAFALFVFIRLPKPLASFSQPILFSSRPKLPQFPTSFFERVLGYPSQP